MGDVTDPEEVDRMVAAAEALHQVVAAHGSGVHERVPVSVRTGLWQPRLVDVTLRPLTRADLPLLGTWLREPLVHEWWHDDPEADALEREYGAAIDGRDPTVLRIGEFRHEPAGFVQWYRLADEPAYVAELAPFLPIPPDAWSLDYLVGGAALRRRGVGSALVTAALAAIGPAPVVVPVHASNPGSAGVLRNAGFVLAAEAQLEPDNPRHTRDHLVFVRAALSA